MIIKLELFGMSREFSKDEFLHFEFDNEITWNTHRCQPSMYWTADNETSQQLQGESSYWYVDDVTEHKNCKRIGASSQFSGVGDDKYGDRNFNETMKGHGLKRLFLHANSLCFRHPLSGESIKVEAPLPDDLNSVLNSLG